MNSTRVLYVGPERRPVTGQSEAFDLLFQSRTAGESFVDFPQNGLSLETIRFIALLMRRLWSVRPDVVYLSISRSGPGFLRDACVIWSAILFRARVVVHLHGADFESFLSTAPPALAWAVRKSYRHVAAAIVLIEPMRAEFQAFPELPVHSIANAVSKGVETAAWKFDRQVSNPKRPLKVLFLSNLLPSKGILELIAAVEHLRKEAVEVELDICGRDGFSPEVDAKVAQATNGVRFHGVVLGKDKVRFLEAAEVVALPSYYPTEAQPISLIEGLHFGCGLLFTDHNYLPAFLTEEVGICVPPRDGRAIAAALRRYADNRDLLRRHADRGREIARTGFSRASHCAAVRAVLLDAARRKM